MLITKAGNVTDFAPVLWRFSLKINVYQFKNLFCVLRTIHSEVSNALRSLFNG